MPFPSNRPISKGVRLELQALLSQPDPPEMPSRRTFLCFAGREDRREVMICPMLMSWWVHREVECNDYRSDYD